MMPIAFLLLIVLALALLPVAVFVARRERRRTGLGLSPWVYLAAIVPGIVFFMFLKASPPETVFFIEMLLLAGVLTLAYVWIREIVHLMGLGEDAFPGRHDKLMWFALIVFLPPIGAPAFAIFRRAYWPAHKPVVNAATRELI